jgi:hypothetical protein
MNAPTTNVLTPVAIACGATAKLDKSTATAAQELRILDGLRISPKTTDDLRRLGVYQVSARIWGLRAKGYNIETALFDGYAADGYSHTRMARYTLLAEPEGGAA